MPYTEAMYENAVIEIFRDTLGYSCVYAPNCHRGSLLVRDYADPLYSEQLAVSLRKANPKLPEAALTEAVYKLRNFEGDLLQKNRLFMDYLQNGVSVNFYDKGECQPGSGQKSALVWLVDYANVERNTFTVANQWTVIENSEKRPDVIIFVNSLPLVVFELKSPSREETDASEAYRQLRNYMHEIPSLFVYNAFLVMSDLATSKAGTITADEDRFMEWKTKDGSYENTQHAAFDTFIEGIFDKARLLDILKNFICFSGNAKILGAYHQYFAVRKAAASTVGATETDGRGGVFWHTQGSGKSLSMVFYAHLLQNELRSPTIVVLTDRNDLDEQLFTQFAKCAEFLRQTPEQAESREHLKSLLAGRQANGIIFTTAQKFEESEDCLSDRRNIVVMADEAHRSQFISERVSVDGKIQKSFGLKLRESLPNATYIGFTGTPISSKDRSTIEVFGNYIDIYDMTQAVEDGATRPVYYESRVIHLKLDEDILRLIDAEYDIMSQNAEEYAIEKSKKDLGRMESILGAEQTITALCEDILGHYENNRQHELTGKAMIVAYSRPIAMAIYHKLLELRPDWSEKVGVVMTSGNNDPEEWRDIIGNKSRKEFDEGFAQANSWGYGGFPRWKQEMGRKFKDDNDTLKIAIVVDMWLTGFDVPSLATMYVYKPMAGHNLMQAIARVNRVFTMTVGDTGAGGSYCLRKEGGLVVDYVGIASALKQAMNDYTARDKGNFGEQNIAKTALPKFIEKLEVCRDLFHDPSQAVRFDYSGFMSDTATATGAPGDLARAKAISGGVNFLSGTEKEKDKEAFIKEAMLLRQALLLCRSLVDAKQRFEAAYFEAVRPVITRVSGEGKPLSLKEINDRINELLKASIKSEGVINLFADINGMGATLAFSLFDPKFLDEIAKMKEKNLAVEILKKLLAEQVSLYRRTNLVKSEKFSEMLSRAMKMYLNGIAIPL